ncbi:unnamed protein product [Anisakis simplex]|uniref:Uncharacterized protein n=1 Tax=Anisakis simplex TaxID=6269 RepID=A0A0M3JJI2_ANISI|nr:unnamed protein product [Anisakis simplex]
MVQPKLTAKKHVPNKDEPRSEYNEQLSLALALSASENPSDEPISVPEPKAQSLRSRKLRPRSYSFIEMEPRSCRCEVFEQIQVTDWFVAHSFPLNNSSVQPYLNN